MLGLQKQNQITIIWGNQLIANGQECPTDYNGASKSTNELHKIDKLSFEVMIHRAWTPNEFLRAPALTPSLKKLGHLP